HVAQKFAAGTLVEFLRAPEAHFTWIRMPNFHLNAKEAGELADFLSAKAEKPAGNGAPIEKSIDERGQKLIQESGCLNCHGAKLENRFSAPSLAALAAEKWEQG